MKCYIVTATKYVAEENELFPNIFGIYADKEAAMAAFDTCIEMYAETRGHALSDFSRIETKRITDEYNTLYSEYTRLADSKYFVLHKVRLEEREMKG